MHYLEAGARISLREKKQSLFSKPPHRFSENSCERKEIMLYDCGQVLVLSIPQLPNL